MDGKNRDIHLVPFDVGLSAVVGKEEQDLKTGLNNTDKNSRFLVVGYASTEGDVASNRKLSSRRASNVVQKIAAVPGVPQDQVKAIYFGQTSRFNAKYLSPAGSLRSGASSNFHFFFTKCSRPAPPRAGPLVFWQEPC